MASGQAWNNFLRRFRVKKKVSTKVYGKKDRRQNKVNRKIGDSYE